MDVPTFAIASGGMIALSCLSRQRWSASAFGLSPQRPFPLFIDRFPEIAVFDAAALRDAP